MGCFVKNKEGVIMSRFEIMKVNVLWKWGIFLKFGWKIFYEVRCLQIRWFCWKMISVETRE